MTETTPTAKIITNEDIAAYAAEIGKAVTDLTPDDYATLAARTGGAYEPPPVTTADLEAAHAAYVVPENVPASVTLRQFKLALLRIGAYADVKAAAEADPVSEIYWSSPGAVERHDPYTIKVALGLGWGPTRLDEVMILAAAQ